MQAQVWPPRPPEMEGVSTPSPMSMPVEATATAHRPTCSGWETSRRKRQAERVAGISWLYRTGVKSRRWLEAPGPPPTCRGTLRRMARLSRSPSALHRRHHGSGRPPLASLSSSSAAAALGVASACCTDTVGTPLLLLRVALSGLLWWWVTSAVGGGAPAALCPRFRADQGAVQWGAMPMWRHSRE